MSDFDNWREQEVRYVSSLLDNNMGAQAAGRLQQDFQNLNQTPDGSGAGLYSSLVAEVASFDANGPAAHLTLNPTPNPAAQCAGVDTFEATVTQAAPTPWNPNGVMSFDAGPVSFADPAGIQNCPAAQEGYYGQQPYPYQVGVFPMPPLWINIDLFHIGDGGWRGRDHRPPNWDQNQGWGWGSHQGGYGGVYQAPISRPPINISNNTVVENNYTTVNKTYNVTTTTTTNNYNKTSINNHPTTIDNHPTTVINPTPGLPKPIGRPVSPVWGANPPREVTGSQPAPATIGSSKPWEQSRTPFQGAASAATTERQQPAHKEVAPPPPPPQQHHEEEKKKKG